MTENKYYTEIMSLTDCDDIKRIVNNWSNFSENKPNTPQYSPIVLPDMLWVAKSGVGTTKLLRLISEYLSSEKIMDFYGDVKYFEFNFEHFSGSSPYGPIEKFSDALLNAAGFRSDYRGIVCINISEWIDHFENKYFLRFLEYLSENSTDWHIVFLVNSIDDKKLNKLEAILGMYFRIDKAVFKYPDTEAFCDYIEKRLMNYGFSISDSAKTILSDTIDELRKSDYFDGYKTISMICSDLIYREFSSENFNGYTITDKSVEYYSKTSEFVKQTKYNIEKRNKIGFVLGEDGDNE